jgi:prepilin-type N-terminal cleavage/methylation domain-containing protein
MAKTSRARGFTLLELLVSTTVALVVVGTATTTIFLIMRALTRSGQSSTADAEAQVALEFLTTQLQGIGGGAVRPWMAFSLQNNATDDGSDVVRFAEVPGDVPGAVTVIEPLGDGRFSFFLVNDGVGRCALADLRRDTDGDGFPQPLADGAARFARDDFLGHQVILTSPTGETWRSVVVDDVGLGSDAASCFAAFATNEDGLVANGALRDADNIDRDEEGAERLDQWVLGQMTFVRTRTWQTRPLPGASGGALALVETLHDRGAPVERTIFEGLRALHVAAGYDHAPTDGVLRLEPDGRDDEWLGNVAGEVSRLPDDLTGLGVPVDALRMLTLEVVTALPRGETIRRVPTLDGAAVSGPEARASTGQVYLRNLLLFL